MHYRRSILEFHERVYRRRAVTRPSRLAALALVLVWGATGAATVSPARADAGVHADVATDAEVLLRLAERGDAKAAWLLGTRYASGRGGVRDDSEAMRWFRRAAELGLPEAQFNLAVMHASGRGVAKDLHEAARWFELAAGQGLAVAQFNIASFYAEGRGVERDERAAARWLMRAAEQGLPRAQYNLGVLSEHGRGMPADPAAAMRWYRAAATQGFEPAISRIAAIEARAVERGLAAAPPSSPPPVPAAIGAIGTTSPSASPAVGRAGGGSGRESLHDLSSLDPGHYTVQLVSHASPALAQAFIARYSLGEKAVYVQVEKSGSVFYSVVYGVFPTVADARASIEALPAELRRSKPWIRSVRGLLAAMR